MYKNRSDTETSAVMDCHSGRPLSQDWKCLAW